MSATNSRYLESINACSKAVEYAKQFKTLQDAWNVCERGDWMLWLIGKYSGEPMSDKRKRLVLVACKCARLSLKHVPSDEERPLKAIEIAEKWANSGDVSRNEIAAAAAGAYAAYAVAAAAYVAYAAAYVAYAANAGAYAAYAATRKETQKECANIVREHYPKIDFING